MNGCSIEKTVLYVHFDLCADCVLLCHDKAPISITHLERNLCNMHIYINLTHTLPQQIRNTHYSRLANKLGIPLGDTADPIVHMFGR